MPIIYEFSTAIEKQYSTQYNEYFGTKFKTSPGYDYNSFKKKNYGGKLDLIYGIPTIIRDYIQRGLLEIKPSGNQPAYAGRYINEEWAILAVVTNIGEYDNEREFLEIKNKKLSPRPSFAYRYFCCQNELNESCNLMAILLNWYRQFNYQFDFKKRELLSQKIDNREFSGSITKNAEIILRSLNNQNQKQPLNRTIDIDDLFSVISNLPNEEKIGFSFAFNVANRESLQREGNFRLVQGVDNIISIINHRVENNINRKIDNHAIKDRIKSSLEKLCKSPFTNSLEDKSRLLELLSSIFNQEIEEQFWKHIFDDFNINKYLSGNKPPEYCIRLLLMQTICLPERVLELTKLKAKWKISGNSNNLVVLEKFEYQLFELITDAYYSKYLIWDEEEKDKPNNSTESYREKNENISDNLDIKSDINADFSGSISNSLENNESDKDIQNNDENKRDTIYNFRHNIYSFLQQKFLIIINYPFKQKIAILSLSLVRIISQQRDSSEEVLTRKNEDLKVDNQQSSKEIIVNETPKYNFSENDYIVIEKLSDKLYEATWQCINQTVESIFDNNDSDVKTDSKRRKKFDIKNIFNANENKSNLCDKNNHIKILSQDSKLWNFILKNQIVMDFYHYFNFFQYEKLLNKNLINFKNLCNQNNNNINYAVRGRVYRKFKEIFQEVDYVITYFFYKLYRKNNPETNKIVSTMTEPIDKVEKEVNIFWNIQASTENKSKYQDKLSKAIQHFLSKTN